MKPSSEKWAEITEYAFRANSKFPEEYLTDGQKPILDWWLNTDATEVLIMGGERAGKSYIAALLLMLSVDLMHPQGSLYWIVGPDYLQGRPEWQYLYNAFSELDLVEGEASMPANFAAPWSFDTILGQTFTTRSSGDITKLASFSVSGAIMAEAAQQTDEVRSKLMGRLSETGGPLIISGTIESGLPWYTDLYERWQGETESGAKSFSLPTWSNNFVYPGGRLDPKIVKLENENTPDYFMERYGAVPRKMSGLVLPEFDMKTHVQRLDVDPNLPVELAIDPGTKCYAVLFVQHVGLKTHILDRVYKRDTIVQEVIPEVMANPLWKLVDPANAGVIDQAGAQRPGSHSQVELWRQIAQVELRYRYIFEEDTIRTLRYHLGTSNPLHEALLLFNSHMTNERNAQGEALDVLAEPMLWMWRPGGYARNEAKKPIDKNNHAMKAIGYKIVDRYGVSMQKRKHFKPKRRAYWGVKG